jgi:hypothetical protein
MSGSDSTYIPHWLRPIETPPCPPGWRTGPPDFVGVGVVRGGTQWWTRVLRSHPRVQWSGEDKGFHYFDRFWDGDPPENYIELYHALFPRPEGKLTGEIGDRYMLDFWAPPLLAAAAPDARLLVLLRDPVERYLSGVSRYTRRAEREDRDMRPQELSEAVLRSTYHKQLERILEYYPREQVMVLQYEQRLRDPVGQAEATFRFLGLEPLASHEEEPEGVRLKPTRWKPTLSDSARREFVARLEDDVQALAGLWPDLDLSLWPHFAHLAATRPASAA